MKKLSILLGVFTLALVNNVFAAEMDSGRQNPSPASMSYNDDEDMVGESMQKWREIKHNWVRLKKELSATVNDPSKPKKLRDDAKDALEKLNKEHEKWIKEKKEQWKKMRSEWKDVKSELETVENNPDASQNLKESIRTVLNQMQEMKNKVEVRIKSWKDKKDQDKGWSKEWEND